MVQAQPQAAFPQLQPAPSSSRGCLKILGCGCLLTALVVVACSAVFYVYWREIAAKLVNAMIDKMVAVAPLTPEEKQSLQTNSKRLTDALRDGSLDMQRVGKALEGSQFAECIVVRGAIMAADSDKRLTTEEKAAFALEMRRLAGGYLEDILSKNDFKSIMEKDVAKVFPKDESKPRFQWPKRESAIEIGVLEPEALRALTPALHEKLTKAGVPAGDYPLDLGKMFHEFVDDALSQKQ